MSIRPLLGEMGLGTADVPAFSPISTRLYGAVPYQSSKGKRVVYSEVCRVLGNKTCDRRQAPSMVIPL